MNLTAIAAIYRYEMSRFFRTLLQSFLSPVLSTSLYFVVFGAAIGSRIDQVEGVSYGAFIVPGLVMLSVITQSLTNAAFGIYFPKFIGTVFELLSAPVSFLEIVIGYVGAAATKALFIGAMIFVTASLFVDFPVKHPLAMVAFLMLTCLSFALLGFIIGIWAGNFEQLQLVPLLIVTPLVFLGGSFYSITMLPPIWQKITLFNPVVYLISGFRWSFFGTADVPVGIHRGRDDERHAGTLDHHRAAVRDVRAAALELPVPRCSVVPHEGGPGPTIDEIGVREGCRLLRSPEGGDRHALEQIPSRSVRDPTRHVVGDGTLSEHGDRDGHRLLDRGDVERLAVGDRA